MQSQQTWYGKKQILSQRSICEHGIGRARPTEEIGASWFIGYHDDQGDLP